MERKAHIVSFDLVKHSGVILTENKKELAFDDSCFNGKIPELNDYPAVIAILKGDDVISLTFDPETARLREVPAKGLAIFGAAKCPKCDWRLPILPSRHLPKIRKGESFDCPECATSLRLKSAFIGFHHYASVGILIVPFILRRFLLRSEGAFTEEIYAVLNMMSLWFIPVQIFLFFYLYFQESLVVNQEAETFS